MLAKTILKRILHFRSQTMKYPQPLAALSSAFLLTVLLAGCSTPPWGGTAKPEGVPLVILDTDIGLSTDDLFALEMLFRYEEAELLGPDRHEPAFLRRGGRVVVGVDHAVVRQVLRHCP